MRRLTLAILLLALPAVGWAQASLGPPGIGYQRVLTGIGPCTTTSCIFTAPILLPAGSDAAKALAFADSPTTGIYESALHYMNIDTNNGGIALTAADNVTVSAPSLKSLVTDTTHLGSGTGLWASLNVARWIQGSRSKSLTDAAAAAAAIRVPVASNGYEGGEVIWNAESTDASDYRTTVGRIRFAAISKGAAPTCTISVVGTDLTASSNGNTLICTWTNVVNGTNCDLSVTCTDNTAGSQTILIRFRPDMPTIATLGFP